MSSRSDGQKRSRGTSPAGRNHRAVTVEVSHGAEAPLLTRIASHSVFVIVGTMGAWSFHCFLADPAYIQHLYRYSANDPHAVPQFPRLWENVANYVTLTRLLSNTLAQMINLTPCVRALGKPERVYAGILLMILVVISPIVITAAHAAELTTFALLLTAVALSGIGTGFQQSTMFSIGAQYPQYGFSLSVLFGMGVAAAATSVCKVITKLSFGKSFDDHRHEATVFFALGAAWGVVAFAALFAFTRSRLGRSKLDPAYATLEGPLLSDDESSRHLSGTIASDSVLGGRTESVALDRRGPYINDSVHSSATAVAAAASSVAPTLACAAKLCGDDVSERPPLLRVLSVVWPLLLINFLIYAASFCVFPGVLIRVDADDAWFKVLIVLAFNVALTVGRGAAGLFSRVVGGFAIHPLFLGGLALVRAAVGVPCFVTLLAGHPDRAPAAYAAAVAFQLAAGLLSGLVAIAIPRVVDHAFVTDDDAKAVSGTVLSLSILLSCICGTLCNLAICHWAL